jgi:ThiJ/PfpI family-like
MPHLCAYKKRFMKKIIIQLLCMLAIAGYGQSTTKTKISMKKKILFVVTSHAVKGSTSQPTGYYLAEVSHPWEVLSKAGYEIDFVSPKGGEPPVDGYNLNDPANKAFVEDAHYQSKIKNS